MRDLIIENSKNVFSKAIGLEWIPRLSTIQVSRAQHIDWHVHDSIEILICHRGTPRYEFETFPPATLHPGRFLVIQPHLQHRVCDGIDGPVSRSSIFLQAPKRNTRIRSFFTTREYRDTIALLLAKRLHPGRVSQEKERELMRLSHLIGRGPELSDLEKLELRALAVSTVVDIAGSRRNGEVKSEKSIVDEAISWIDAHLDQKFALEDLIAHIGYGRTRFFTLFKDKTGLSPLEWTIRRRMEKAKQLLTRENQSIAETARAVGFQSTVFFSKTFRTQVGLTPTAWRNRATEGGEQLYLET